MIGPREGYRHSRSDKLVCDADSTEDSLLALARTSRGLETIQVATPTPAAGEALVRVELVGLCRTDLAVASGQLAVAPPRILGHEMVGEVVEVGEGCRRFRGGETVSIDPVIPCRRCSRCQEGWTHSCRDRRFLGVHQDGVLRELIALPEANLWEMNRELDPRALAMLEPIAACAAVLKAPIVPSQRGMVLGADRLAVLTQRVLAAHGFYDLVVKDPFANRDPAPVCPEFDFVIDTTGQPAGIGMALHWLRPRGCLVVKSRRPATIKLPLEEMVASEIHLEGVNYANFGDARRLLQENQIEITDLLGPIWSSSDSVDAFSTATNDPNIKHFLKPPCLVEDECDRCIPEVACVWNHRLHL